MKLKELQVIGGTVYLNIVHADTTDTKTMTAQQAVGKYGELEVIEHHPYVPTTGEDTALVPDASPSGSTAPKRGKQAPRPGTDVVILRGQ